MTRGRGTWSMRDVGAIALCALLAACSGTPASQSPGSAPGSGTNGPSALPADTGAAGSLEPLETPEPIDTGPLPAPTLATADDIVTAMADPDQAPEVVVSMLQLLGIGLYQPNGTPIRTGTERKDDDFYAFEPEARGLVAMLRSRNTETEQLSFRDFHAALASLGFSGSAEQLATAYQDAYVHDPGAAVSELVTALGGVDVDGSISGFEAWLLLVDGFVPPNEAATAMANGGSWEGPVAFGGGSWGVARLNLQPYLSPQMQAQRLEFGVRLMAVAHAASIDVTTDVMSVHEGHGSLGSPMQAFAKVVVGQFQFVSPSTGNVVLSSNPEAEHLRIGWAGDADADAHGSLNGTTSRTDATGRAQVTYTPKQETANGVGILREFPAHLNAFFFNSDLILALFGSASGPYLPLVTGETERYAIFYAGWHEKAQASVKIRWTDTYNGVADTITFLGELDHVDPGPNGMPDYWGMGTATGSRAAWAACNPGVDTPSGTSQAFFHAYPTRDGYIEIAAYVAGNEVLSGISTEPVEVPLTDGTTLIDPIGPPTPNENGGADCPHGSYGEVTLSGLTLPPLP